MAPARAHLSGPLLAVLVTAGCSSPLHGPIVIPPPVTVTGTPRAIGAAGVPVTVNIPTLGIHADHLIALGLNPDKTIQTPDVKTPELLGWYSRGIRPCETGAFALIGHIDGSGRKGVLFGLRNLKPGDTVTVTVDNGASCTYRIDELAEVQKSSFPTEKVWGDTLNARIRIISCGGPWVGLPFGYRDNLIGLGTLVSYTK